jgi:hypothetical protein
MTRVRDLLRRGPLKPVLQGIGDHLFTVLMSQFAEHVDQSSLAIGQDDVPASIWHEDQRFFIVIGGGPGDLDSWTHATRAESRCM